MILSSTINSKCLATCVRIIVKTETGRAVILKAARSLFRRIIVMPQVINIQMVDILIYPLAPTPDGLLRKTKGQS